MYNYKMSFTVNTCIPVNTCSECKETLEDSDDEDETCGNCGKNICSYRAKLLSQDGNSYYGCDECYDKETERIENRKLMRRKGFIDSVRLSCAYRGVLEDDSMTLLNVVLEDYLKNGTLYLNKEIMIVDNDKVHVYQTDNGKAPSIKYKSIKYKSIKYKMVLNLYNYNCGRSDTFTIKST